MGHGDENSKRASRKFSKIQLDIAACTKQYQTLRNMHGQQDESSRMDDLKKVWETACSLIETVSRDIEGQKMFEDFEQKISLLQSHIEDQVFLFVSFVRVKMLTNFSFLH